MVRLAQYNLKHESNSKIATGTVSQRKAVFICEQRRFCQRYQIRT